MLSLLLLLSAPAFAAQAPKLKNPLTREACDAAKGQWIDENQGYCFLQKTQLTGKFIQETTVRARTTEEECNDTQGRFEASDANDGSGWCNSRDENSIGVDAGPKGKDFVATFYINGSPGNGCEGVKIPMKATGDGNLKGQSKDASKEYALELVYTDQGLEVNELLGAKEKDRSASPGCGAKTYLKGNGGTFLRAPGVAE